MCALCRCRFPRKQISWSVGVNILLSDDAEKEAAVAKRHLTSTRTPDDVCEGIVYLIYVLVGFD